MCRKQKRIKSNKSVNYHRTKIKTITSNSSQIFIATVKWHRERLTSYLSIVLSIDVSALTQSVRVPKQMCKDYSKIAKFI